MLTFLLFLFLALGVGFITTAYVIVGLLLLDMMDVHGLTVAIVIVVLWPVIALFVFVHSSIRSLLY